MENRSVPDWDFSGLGFPSRIGISGLGFLGHRDVSTTMIYTQFLIEALVAWTAPRTVSDLERVTAIRCGLIAG